MSVESERVVAAVYQRLAGDATLTEMLPSGAAGVTESVVAPGTALPRVDVDIPSSVDVTPLGGARSFANTLVAVTARGRGTTRLLLPIADRVDTLLQGYAVVIDGVELGRLVRERGFRLPVEVEASVFYPAIYQEYRVHASAA